VQYYFFGICMSHVRICDVKDVHMKSVMIMESG
jgi:hypothetical protein